MFIALATYLGSSYVNDFTIYGRNFRVVAQADTGYREDIQNLDKYYVRNQQGNGSVKYVDHYKVIENAPLISHFNLFRTAEINGNAAEGYSSGEAIEALKEVAAKLYLQVTVMSLAD